MKLDSKDYALLHALRVDSRVQLKDLVTRTGVARSTAHDRVQRLLSLPLRCVSLLNWEALGVPFAFIVHAPFEESFVEHAAVNSLVCVAPQHALMHCLFLTATEVEAFCAQYPKAKLHPISGVVCAEQFLPQPTHI